MNSRKIKIHNSEITVCRYYDNGYCRFEVKCRFHHPKEDCHDQAYGGRNCQKRHPKNCKFYTKRKCKFNDKCAYKHSTENIVNTENTENWNVKTKI